MKKIIPILLLVALLIALPMIGVNAASSTVYVSDSGSDSNAGTSSAPYKTLDKAISSVSNNGTVEIKGTLTLASGFSWGTHNKTVTITGGTLNVSAVNELVIGDNVTFKNLAITVDESDAIFANGYKVKFDSGVTTSAGCSVYGGGKSGSSVASTDLTVLSGNFTRIFGGSKGGTVTGDTNVYVGGNANSSCDESSHSSTYCVFGGGNGDTVKGSTNVTFADSAKANYVYGGSSGSSEIGVASNLTVTGGKAMSLYGCSNGNKDVSCNVNLTITGGTFQQVFGASTGASLTGNVAVNVLGGTITRRVYGGCYNEVSSTGTWSSNYYVIGNVVLTLGGNANISFSSSDNDRSIYAHSRQKTLSSSENTTILFADQTAYNTYKNKLGAQDFAMKIIMLGVSYADTSHYYTYTADAGKITAQCASHSSYAATATMTLNESASRAYTGFAITPVTLTHSSDWETEKLSIVYANNINVGTATATITTASGVSATLSFEIERAPQTMPTLTAVAETIKGKADGSITGLTDKMEIGTDGQTFTPVTDPKMTFAGGTYYVRLAEKPNYLPSDPVTVTIESGRFLTVTFKAEGSADIVKEVEWNATLTEIPEIPARTGYTNTPPVWSETNFTGIQKDMVVNAIYTKDFVPGQAVVVPSDTTAATTETATVPTPDVTDPIGNETNPVDPTETTADEIGGTDTEEVPSDAETTAKPSASTTGSAEKETDATTGGCGATVSLGGAAISLISAAIASMLIRKREED